MTSPLDPLYFGIDVHLLLSGGREIDGDCLTIRTYTDSAANGSDDRIDALDRGAYPGTAGSLIPLHDAHGSRVVYLDESAARADADLLSDELAWRLAEDVRQPHVATLLTISNATGATYTLRLSEVHAYRIRVWQVAPERGARLLPG